MGNLTSPTPQQLLTEAIIFWTIGFVLFVLRLVSRSLQNGGVKHLLPDDYVMCATFCFFTALMVLINVSANYATNLYEKSEEAQILADPKNVQDRIFGSKIVIGLEQCMMLSTWGVKTVLLTMWLALTKNVRHNLLVKIVASYVFVGFVVIEVTYFTVWCRPFSEYWALPVKDPQCATYQHYSVTQAVFNISSDLLILAIPVPVFIGLNLPVARRLMLISIFSLGIFVILAAILNKYYNFSNPQTTIYMIWYIRESSTAIYVACLLTLWPLISRVFGLRRAYGAHTEPRSPGVKLRNSNTSTPTSPTFPRSSGRLDSTRLNRSSQKKNWRHRMAGSPADISVSAALQTTDSLEEMVEKDISRTGDDASSSRTANTFLSKDQESQQGHAALSRSQESRNGLLDLRVEKITPGRRF